MPDPLERIRPRLRSSAPVKASVLSAVATTNKRTVGSAALIAIMLGIVFNAVALQHGRRLHSEQLAAPAVAAVAPVAPIPQVSVPPVLPQSAPAAQRPPPPSRAPRSDDAIADFLKADSPDESKLTRAAQLALAKLGFDVRPTGALDRDTRNALRKFEKSQRLPALTEITPKLVRMLRAAAASD